MNTLCPRGLVNPDSSDCVECPDSGKCVMDEDQSPRCPICLNGLKRVEVEPGAPVYECEHCGKRIRIWDYP